MEHGRVAPVREGLDLVGDWSPVRVSGLARRVLYLTEHPPLAIDPPDATRRNEALNLALLETLTTDHELSTTTNARLAA